jgi:hypothetical protein
MRAFSCAHYAYTTGISINISPVSIDQVPVVALLELRVQAPPITTNWRASAVLVHGKTFLIEKYYVSLSLERGQGRMYDP